MSTIEQLKAAFPDLSPASLAELSGEDVQAMLDGADDAAEAGNKRNTPPSETVKVSLPVESISDSALLRGHRVAGDKALSCPPPVGGKKGSILVPGDLIELADVGGNVETWNRLVNIGRIFLDRDSPDPGRPA